VNATRLPSQTVNVPEPRVDYDGRPLVASHGPHKPVRIHLHDTESHDAAGIRDLAGIAAYWHGVSWGPGAHVGVDAEGLSARYVNDGEVAYHTARRNTGALGIEIVGFASFLPSVWLARPAQLETVAQWLAHWSSAWRIPLSRSTEFGVSTHAEQSRKYGGDHYDPGRFFPVDKLIARAWAIVQGAKPKPPPSSYRELEFWLWLRWYLGEGEFRSSGPHNMTVRPQALPERIPRSWWRRSEAFVARRAKASGRREDV
jgi:hypothetical protein